VNGSVGLIASAVLSLAAIAFGVAALVLTWRLSPEDERAVVTASVQAEQQLEFIRGGEFVLWVEGPLLTTRSSGLKYELIDSVTGQAVPAAMIFLRAKQTGLSGRTRWSVRRFVLPRPGRFTLVVRGVRPGTDYASLRLIFRPKQTDSGAIPLVVKRLLWVLVVVVALAGFVLTIITAAGAPLTRPM